jgi:hypothetical protein
METSDSCQREIDWILDRLCVQRGFPRDSRSRQIVTQRSNSLSEDVCLFGLFDGRQKLQLHQERFASVGFWSFESVCCWVQLLMGTCCD